MLLKNKSVESYRVVYKNKDDFKLKLNCIHKENLISQDVKILPDNEELSITMIPNTESNVRKPFSLVRWSNKKFFIHREVKVAKVILIKVLLFSIAWSPYLMIAVISQLSENIELYITPYTTVLPALFAKTSIIYNALVYTFTHKDCRNYLNKLMVQRKRKPIW
jgi:hypothetical protein